MRQTNFTSPFSSSRINIFSLNLQTSDEENSQELYSPRKRKRESKLAVVRELRFDGLNHLPKLIAAKNASRCKNEKYE